MKNRTRARLSAMSAGAVALAVVVATSMAVASPTTISYVGELRAENGLPYDGTVGVVATLFDAASAGNVVRAAEDLGAVMAYNGLIQLQIGATGGPIVAALGDAQALWLELEIDGVTLSPRQRLSAVPYAMQAADAENLGGAPASEYVTQAALAATAASAASAATAPANPAAGTLWWDAANANLYIWDGGLEDWVPVSATEVTPDNLPGNGMGAASNGMLSNEFEGVDHLWTEGVSIEDATIAGDGVPALAVIDVDEGGESYIYAIQVETQFTLTSANDIEMRLFPPAGTGVGPITLRSGLLTFGPYGDIWTLDNAPALGDLLGTNPAGEWTLAVVDRDNNLQAPATAGSLNSFAVVYNVVRSNHLTANGVLEVDSLRITGSIKGSVESNAPPAVSGSFDLDGEVVRKVQYATYAEAMSDGTGDKRQLTFTKLHDDTWLKVHWNDNTTIANTSHRSYDIRFNGNNCNNPNNLRISQRAWNSTNGYERGQNDFVGFCNRISGITPVPDVNGGVNIPAGTYTVTVHSNSSSQQVGWNNSYGSLTIEEVFLN